MEKLIEIVHNKCNKPVLLTSKEHWEESDSLEYSLFFRVDKTPCVGNELLMCPYCFTNYVLQEVDNRLTAVS